MTSGLVFTRLAAMPHLYFPSRKIPLPSTTPYSGYQWLTRLPGISFADDRDLNSPVARNAASGRAVITTLADDAALESVIGGADGLPEGLAHEALHISISIIAAATA